MECQSDNEDSRTNALRPFPSSSLSSSTASSSMTSSTTSSRKMSEGSTSSIRFQSPPPSENVNLGPVKGGEESSRTLAFRYSSSSSDSSYQSEGCSGRVSSPSCNDQFKVVQRTRSGGEGGTGCDCNVKNQTERFGDYPDSLADLLRDTTPTPVNQTLSDLHIKEISETSPTKPVLKKADAVDWTPEETVKKKMERGISHATGNETLVLAARTVVQQDFSPRGSSVVQGQPSPTPSDLETPLFTFTLPDLTRFPEDFRGFLEKDLIEMSALISLEQAGRLNWWADTGTCQRLWPLATTGDGNCLLHAASLGMWGFHDRLLTLRKALYAFLTTSPSVDAIYRRWRLQATQQNIHSGLSLTESEWNEEWSSVLRLASSQPRGQSGKPTRRRSRLSTISEDVWENPLYESLEEIHVMVLAHVIRRPIIIVADLVLKDAFGEALAPIPFGGIYLPLEIPASECHKCPLILTYDSGHFSALVSMQPPPEEEFPLPAVIPVTDFNHVLLKIQYGVDPMENINWSRDYDNPSILSRFELQEPDKLALLRDYLDLVQVPLPACFLDPAVNSDLQSPESVESVVAEEAPEPGLPKSKTAKQIQSVAKQFGSLGKTVSKKLKKNLGNITRLARTGSFKGLRKEMRRVSQTTRLPGTRIVGGHQDHILAAMVETQHSLPYQEEMVGNYLHEAKHRFLKDKELKQMQALERRERDKGRANESECINPACREIGSASTSYLCNSCYNRQIADETDSIGRSSQADTGALYGSGNSKFYVNPDPDSYSRRESPAPRFKDPSLYLVNSTFYRDTVPDLVVPVSRNQPDPLLIVPVDGAIRTSTKPGEKPCQPPKPPSRKKTLPANNDSRSSALGNDQYNTNLKVKVETGTPCQTKGCSFFGSPETHSYCSKCFKEQRRVLQASQV